MTAGNLNLTTISGGATEIDLINVGLDQDYPKFSFFNTVYRRHTNFSIDSRQLQQVGTGSGFGDTFTFRFTEEGDLVGDSYLEFVLPAVTDCFEDNSQPTTYANWVNAVGFAIINELKLKVKTVTADNQDGTFLNILNELNDPHRKLWPLVGKVDDPTKLKFFQTQPTKYIVPLSFSFSKFTGLAYPRFLPNKDSQFEIILTLRNLNNIILHDGGTLKESPPNISGVKIISTYYTLEDYERTRLKKLQNFRIDGKPKSGKEAGHLIQLIETVQKNSVQNQSSITLTGINGNIKEILWVFQPPGRTATTDPLIRDNFALDRLTGNDHINYAGTTLTNNAADPFTSLEIDVGGNFTFQSRPASHFRQYLPYKKHSNVPQSYVYCFPLCINPEEYQPSGTYNMGITGQSMTFRFSGVPSGYNIKMYVIAYKYLKISTRDVTIDKDIIKDAVNRDNLYDLPSLGAAIDIYADESSGAGAGSIVSKGGRSGTGTGEIPDDVVNNIASSFNQQVVNTNARFLTLQEIISNVQANMNTLNKSLTLIQEDVRRLSQSQGGSQLSTITARSAAADANIPIARVNKSKIR